MPETSVGRPWAQVRWMGGAVAIICWLALSGGGVEAQEVENSPDSASIVEEARQLQADFERFRGSRIPPRTRTANVRCDRQIGRICHWFGGAEEADFPPEPTETSLARRQLIGTLGEVWAEVRDPWIAGQLVHYLVEAERFPEALSVARGCELTEPWWCHALEGYVLHVRGGFVEAEDAFSRALALLPGEEEERWGTPRFLLSRQAESAFRNRTPEERRIIQDRLWRFSDPLFLVEGNDRLTDHYARLVLARIREDAVNPHDLVWGEDLEETLIRYGRTVGWSRSRAVPSGGMNLTDTRSMVGHHHPGSRGYLFPEEFLDAPADVPPESWITAPREAHTWYAAPYAPDFRGLETQVARFRRGDSLLVVGAFRPDPAPSPLVAEDRGEERPDPFGGRNLFGGGGDERGDASWGSQADRYEGPVETGFFLVPEDGGEPIVERAEDRSGVLTLMAPIGRYVSSLEVLDRPAGAAWRARQGVSQVELPRGLVALSDILLLSEEAPVPDRLEDAIPHARAGIRIQREERFVVVWEVYGLGVEEPARVTVGFTRGRPGFLQRVGEFLGVVEPDSPIEVSFDEPGIDEVQTLFRAFHLELPNLEPGEYTLHVRLELAGREPVVTSRPIILEP